MLGRYSDLGDKCSYCTSPCKTCKSLSDTDCITCEDPYYISDTECKECDVSCGGCTGPLGSECTYCAEGYYRDNDRCLACVYPCGTCHNEFECIECASDPDLRFDAPSCMCKYELHDNGANCLACPSPCKGCNSESVTDCVSCLDGYWLDGNECPACDEGCVTCINIGNVCESCKDGWYLVGT